MQTVSLTTNGADQPGQRNLRGQKEDHENERRSESSRIATRPAGRKENDRDGEETRAVCGNAAGPNPREAVSGYR
ncbi:hypothetical protein, partial [Gaiella sp.]|uniref:hypothetical protein n=1 Tax=Gaiella sp. TaxID=2663207 RepID=UPI003267831A